MKFLHIFAVVRNTNTLRGENRSKFNVSTDVTPTWPRLATRRADHRGFHSQLLSFMHFQQTNKKNTRKEKSNKSGNARTEGTEVVKVPQQGDLETPGGRKR